MSDELDLEEILREVKRMNADPAHSGKSRPETPAEPAPAPEPQADPAPAESPRAARRRQEREQRRIKQRALLRSAPFFRVIWGKIKSAGERSRFFAGVFDTVDYAVIPVLLMIISTALLVSEKFNPFLYFRF